MQDQTLHRIIEAPIRLGFNPVRRRYRGGAAVQAFRGIPAAADSDRPEDWVGSVGAAQGDGQVEGASEIEIEGAGRTSLRQLVERYPREMLGDAAAGTPGAGPGVLVKLLSTAQRLPLQAVPSRAFAERHLGGQGGGPLGWIVLGAPGWLGEPARVGIGFRQHVTPPWFAEAVARQDSASLWDAVQWQEVQPGESLLVGPGVPHSIGPGVFLVELGAPSAEPIVADWKSDGLTEQQATLDQGWGMALQSFDYTTTSWRLATGMSRQIQQPIREGADGREVRLFGPKAAGTFDATRLDVWGEMPVQGGRFSVLIVTGGEGAIEGDFGRESLRRGDTFACAAALGYRLRAGATPLQVIRCAGPVA